MHVIARGALIGGAVGAALAAVRGGGKGDAESSATESSATESSATGRYVKSIAEGALAGAGVAFLLDRRLRDRAASVVAERGPELVDTLTDLAGEMLDSARPHVIELAGMAREAAEHAYDSARPRVLELADAARHRAADFRAA